jgi:long-chain acyl-CoA synthetase
VSAPATGSPARAEPTPAAATLSEALQQSLARHAGRAAIGWQGRRWRHGELEALSRALAAYWQQRGLAAGDRLAMLLPAGAPLAVVVVAALRAGLVLVPLDPALPAAALEQQLRDSGAKAVVAARTATPLPAALHAVLVLRLVVQAGDLLSPWKAALLRRRQRAAHSGPGSEGAGGADSAPHGSDAVAFSVALERGRALPWQPPAVRPDDIAALLYTGATTGPARAVVLLQRQWLANLQQLSAWFAPLRLGAGPGDDGFHTLASLPLHHVFGLSLALLYTLLNGGCLLIPAADPGPSPGDTPIDALMALLLRERIALLPATGATFEALARHPLAERVDWSGLRLPLAGGMAVDAAAAMLWLLKTGQPIVQGYGLVECSPAVSCDRVDATHFSGHVGWPLPGTELRIADDSGQPLPPGAVGEVWVRGPQLMAGYWQRPDETARVMRPGGWLRTGDLGRLADDGALWILGRRDDLIWAAGLPVLPSDVEDAVMRLAGVRECAAVGLPPATPAMPGAPGAAQGERIKLVVVRRDPQAAEPDEATLQRHCERHLAGHQRPALIEFRHALPRTALGQVLRRALKEGPAA